MTPDSFNWLAAMLRRESGLVIDSGKQYLLDARLAPLLRRYEVADLDALVAGLRRPGRSDWIEAVVDAMTTNETSFFRDEKPFNVLCNEAMPILMAARSKTRRLRIWSAVCSTGQEPYSILMGVAERVLRASSWNIELVASDLSSKALERAKAGRYNHFEVQRGLPPAYLVKYFSQSGKDYEIKQELKDQIRFLQQNLKDPFLQLGVFDVIFCRNVLIYFDAETKNEILRRMTAQLSPDGFLFLGGAETLRGASVDLERVRYDGGVAYRKPQAVTP